MRSFLRSSGFCALVVVLFALVLVPREGTGGTIRFGARSEGIQVHGLDRERKLVSKMASVSIHDGSVTITSAGH